MNPCLAIQTSTISKVITDERGRVGYSRCPVILFAAYLYLFWDMTTWRIMNHVSFVCCFSVLINVAEVWYRDLVFVFPSREEIWCVSLSIIKFPAINTNEDSINILEKVFPYRPSSLSAQSTMDFFLWLYYKAFRQSIDIFKGNQDTLNTTFTLCW